MAWLWLLLSIATSFAIAFAFRSALRWEGRRLSGAWAVLFVAEALTPCIVPLAEPPFRFAAALFAVAMLVKLYDLLMQAPLAQRLTLPAFAIYLLNWFQLVLAEMPPPVPAKRDAERLLWTVPVGLVVIGICVGLFVVDWTSVPFTLEHCLKVTGFVVGVTLITNAAASAWRLAGGEALDPMNHPAVATTPAEFWRRWNQPVQQFVRIYVYEPIARRSGSAFGLFAAFVISGLVHEYVFDIASGRVQGWQLLFFSIQGVAVAATFRFRPRGALAAICIGLTAAFNLATAWVFFRSLNELVPFYFARG